MAAPFSFYGTKNNGGQAMVECTTCHNPHLENKYKGTIAKFPTSSFIRGWYNESL